MTNEHSFRGLPHWATHRIPGVPAHAEHPAGHQGRAVRRRPRPRGAAPHLSPHRRWHRSLARPPRFMVAWQRRIAALFGQEL